MPDLMLFLLIGGLATWRISHMLMMDAGPFDLFILIRVATRSIGHDDDGVPISYSDNFWGGLFSCIYCMSVWIGGAFALLYLLVPDITMYLCLPFALSALAIWFDSLH